MSRRETLPLPGRRAFLLGAGATLLAACSDPESGGETQSTSSLSTSTSLPPVASELATTTAASRTSAVEILTPAMFASLAVCTLTAPSAAGPFPTQAPLDRREIHEGYPGHPLRLGIRVVDQDCSPIPGAKVEIWHTDAGGDYSEYLDNGDGKDEGEGSTFCRGRQTADADGILEFETIYPGWYPGRAVHIHTKVFRGSDLALTAQLYFDEAYSAAVYETGEYAQFGPPDTGWSADRLASNPVSDGSIITLREAETAAGVGTLGLTNLSVG